MAKTPRCGASMTSGIGTILICAKPLHHRDPVHEDRFKGRATLAPYGPHTFRTHFTDEDIARQEATQ